MNESTPNKNRRVLVIDDNRAIHDDFRKILCPANATSTAMDATEAALFGGSTDTLKPTRFEVDSAFQGQEGALLVKKAMDDGRPYALAFVDVRMPPGWDGVETTLKMWELDPDLQVVFCTAYSDYSWGELFEKLDQRDGWLILKKPFDAVEALQMAYALTEKWGLHQQSMEKMEELERRVAERTAELVKTNATLQAEIVERTRMEKTLIESERRYHALFDGSADGIVIVDIETKAIKYANSALCRMLGYTEAELCALGVADIHPPESLPHVVAEFEAQARGEKILAAGLPCLRKDGSVFPADISATKMTIGGRPCNVGFFRDITERKQAETALRMFQFASDNAADEIFWLDPNAGFYYVNDQACRSLGYTREELMRLNLFDIDPIFPKQRWEETWRNFQTGQIEIFRAESCHRRKDGSVFPIEVMSKHLCFGDLNLNLAVTHDITERKQAEAALAYERDLLRTLLDQSLDHIYFKDAQSRFIKASQTMARQFKVTSPEEMVGKTDFDFFAEAHARPAFEDEQEIIRTGIPLVGKVEQEVWQDGHETWALTSKMPFRNRDGEIVGTFGVSKDITAMKQAEETLIREQAHFRFVFENLPVGVALARQYPDGRLERIINDAHLRIAGLTPEQDRLPEIYRQITHPEDYARQTELGRELNDGRDGQFSMEKRYVRLDGSVVWVVYSFLRHHRDDGSTEEMTSVVDITELKQAEERLRQLSRAVEQSPAGIVITDPAGNITYVNPKFTALTGYTFEEALGQNPRFLKSGETPSEAYVELWQTITAGKEWRGEFHNKKKNGELYWESALISPIFNAAGKITHFLGVVEDTTDRKLMESRLFQSQKMETVGKLAGGIAHEFNSILTAIIGQSELLCEDLPAGSLLSKNAADITVAAGRAATLTRQLLAYGRKQFLRPEILDLNQVVTGMDAVLRHLMGGETTGVDIVPAPGLHSVRADSGQIEQVIINLAMNAHDAMPNGGKLTLETANVSFAQDSVGRHPELKPGDYVMLAISDTGTGMGADVKAHVFEPFFTTKDVGQGTGLGLSTCYGIIKQSGGHIGVYSEPGRGTTFKIYLPQAESPAQVPVQPPIPTHLPRGIETILLVEDDPALREMAAALLRRLGYTVLAAANGIEALNLKQQPGTGHIDLLFTDVVMPHMSGKELADRVRVLYPHTRILFTSAYTEHAIVHQGMLDQGVALLPKPFTPAALANKVREVLNQPEIPKPDPS